MNPLKWFRRTRPTPPPEPALNPREMIILRWHNLTPEKWSALTNPERAEYRNIYMKVTMP